MTAKPKTGVFKRNGSVSVFADPAAAQASFTLPLPGQVGSRNVLRGDGFASWDMSLGKRWKTPWENQSLQFRWEVFNVPNLTRFNAQGVGASLLTSLTQSPGGVGAYNFSWGRAAFFQDGIAIPGDNSGIVGKQEVIRLLPVSPSSRRNPRQAAPLWTGYSHRLCVMQVRGTAEAET